MEAWGGSRVPRLARIPGELSSLFAVLNMFLNKVHLVTQTQADRYLLLLDPTSTRVAHSLGNPGTRLPPGSAYCASAPIVTAASKETSPAASSLGYHELFFTFQYPGQGVHPWE